MAALNDRGITDVEKVEALPKVISALLKDFFFCIAVEHPLDHRTLLAASFHTGFDELNLPVCGLSAYQAIQVETTDRKTSSTFCCCFTKSASSLMPRLS